MQPAPIPINAFKWDGDLTLDRTRRIIDWVTAPSSLDPL